MSKGCGECEERSSYILSVNSLVGIADPMSTGSQLAEPQLKQIACNSRPITSCRITGRVTFRVCRTWHFLCASWFANKMWWPLGTQS